MINCVGTLQGTSGYASHYRGVVNALNKLTECKIVSGLTPGFEREVNDAELEMIKREQEYDINLIITHPLYWKANLSAKRNFVYLVWEGDSVPKWILEECMNDRIEKIIVPSQHTKEAVLNTIKNLRPDMREGHTNDLIYVGVVDKVVVIPHGHNPEDFYPLQSEKPKVGGKFKFLANKGFRNLEDRGGLQYLIKAYLEEFSDKDNVELVLKINAAYGIPNLLELFPELKKKGHPKIKYITENYSVKQLNKLYNECDVFVSPTRAEAFNIPCLEAMACGKPVITTDFGGQTDFCDEITGWLIHGKLTEVKHEIEYEGIKWLTPKHDFLKNTLRRAYNNKAHIVTKGASSKRVADKLTWDNTAKQIHDLI